MKDPYIYENGVLINKLKTKDDEKLKTLENLILIMKIINMDDKELNVVERLKDIHRYLYGDIYEWAGKFRTIPIEKSEPILGNDTIRYSQPKEIEKELIKVLRDLNSKDWTNISLDEKVKTLSKDIAKIWQIHPFRDGNTRTTVIFMKKFCMDKEIKLNLSIIKNNANYFRNCLVKASDGQYAETKYLEKIIRECIQE